MKKLSRQDAQIIASQVTVHYNRGLKRAYDADIKAAEKQAYTDNRWQTVLSQLGRHGALKFSDRDRNLVRVFGEFREEKFPVENPVYVVEKDALRLVEYYALKGFEGEELEAKVLKAWQDEQH